VVLAQVLGLSTEKKKQCQASKKLDKRTYVLNLRFYKAIMLAQTAVYASNLFGAVNTF